MPSNERHTPEDLEALGLDEADLQSFGHDAPREEGDLAEEPILDAAPAAPAADKATPAAAASEPSPSQPTPGSEPPAPTAPAAPAAPASASAPDPSAPTATPWTFTADGSRITLGHATADGSVVFAADELPTLQRHLADRNQWRQREAGYQQRIVEAEAAADPARNETVVLSTLLARDMIAARQQGEEALYDWVVGFFNHLPRLQAEARATAVEADNRRLRSRVDPIEQQQRWESDEPVLKGAVEGYLDQYLSGRYADLKPLKAQLGERLWKAKDRVLVRADRDYPEAGIRKGEWAVQFGAMEDLLDAALVATQAGKGAVDRAAAAARNAAALARPNTPPAPSVAGSPVPSRDQRAAPKNRQEYRERLDELAGGRS